MSENTAAVQTAQPEAAVPVRNKFGAQKKKKKRVPKWIKITIALIILAAVVFGIYALTAKLTKKEKVITTDFVTTNTLQSQVTGYGNIEPRKKSEYGAKTRGTVLEVLVKGGDIVKTGDLLFTIDPTEFRTELENAQKKLDSASKTLRDAQEAVNKTSFTAPFRGKLIKKGDIEKGQDISAGAVIGTLVDDSTMKLALYFNYAYENQIKVGQTVAISVPDSMTQTTGTVSSIDKVKKPIDGAQCFRVNVSIKNLGSLAAEQAASGYITTATGDIMPSETGKLEYNNKKDLTMPVGGKVSFADLMEYGEYKSGQSMVTVDGEDLRAAVNTAQLSYDDALKQVNELQKSMTETEVRSEIDGMVSAIMVSAGDKLTASGTPILTISDTSSLIVKINIDEVEINKVSLGMGASISYNDGADMAIGEVTYVSFEAKTEQGGGWNSGAVAYFPAEIALEKSEKLLPGMGVNYTLTSLIKENCLTVPSSAVVYTQDGSTVVYVKEGGEHSYDKFEMPEGVVPTGFYAVKVEIGLSDDRNTEIVSGLNEGTEVYTIGTPSEGSDGMMGGGGMMIG